MSLVTDLVNRATLMDQEKAVFCPGVLRTAAIQITELESENARLREAMLLISGYATKYANATVVRMAKVARAALNQGEKA